MRQRVAITISTLVAAAVLAVGLTAAGFGPAPRAALGEEVEVAPLDAAVSATEAEDPPAPEIVYVKPAPEPRTVVVKKRVKQQRAQASRSSSSRQVRASRSYDDDDDDRAEHRREREHEEREHEEREHEDDD